MAPATEPQTATSPRTRGAPTTPAHPPARSDAGSAAGHGGRWRPEAADGARGGGDGARAWRRRLLVGEGERSGGVNGKAEAEAASLLLRAN